MSPSIVPVDASITSVSITEDSEGGLTATVTYDRGRSPDTGKVIDFSSGPHGTSAIILLPDGRLLCITQSGTMTPVAYYLEGVKVTLPEAPPEVTP
jgi:hypothetical protein